MAFVPALALAGTALSAVGTIGQGIAQGNTAAYNAAVARNNATEATQNATYALQAGESSTEDEGLKASEQLGQVKTGLAGNNIDVNSGSAAKVIQGTRQIGALDQDTTMGNANLQAYGYRTQAVGYTAQSKLDTQASILDPIGADVGAAGSFLSGLSGVAKLPGTFTVGGSAPTGIGSDYVASGGIGI